MGISQPRTATPVTQSPEMPYGPADASSPSNGPNPAKPYWSPANNVSPPQSSLGGSVGGGINMDMYQQNQGLRRKLAQQDTANASRLQAFGDPANQKPNGRSFLMGYPEMSTRQQELGQRADAAIVGSPFAQQIPLEQQGFARGQMRRPGVMSQQEPASQLEETNAYGLRSMRNFAPTMQESNAAGGMTGQLGIIGTSSLIRRPDGGMSLMGPNAAKSYAAQIGDRVAPVSAMRQVMQDSMASNRASEPYKNRLVAMKTRADAEKTQQQAGQYISALRQQGMRPSADDVRRSIGMPEAGAATAKPAAPKLSLDERSAFANGERQAEFQGKYGFAPETATPRQVYEAIQTNGSVDDPQERDAYRKAIAYARSRKGFAEANDPYAVQIDNFMADPSYQPEEITPPERNLGLDAYGMYRGAVNNAQGINDYVFGRMNPAGYGRRLK